MSPWVPTVSDRYQTGYVTLDYPFNIFCGDYYTCWIKPVPQFTIVRIADPSDWLGQDPPNWEWTKPRPYDHAKDGI